MFLSRLQELDSCAEHHMCVWFTFCIGNILRLRVRVQVSLISLIGQTNNGVACLSHVESEAPRMRIVIQKAEHLTSFLFRK